MGCGWPRRRPALQVSSPHLAQGAEVSWHGSEMATAAAGLSSGVCQPSPATSWQLWHPVCSVAAAATFAGAGSGCRPELVHSCCLRVVLLLLLSLLLQLMLMLLLQEMQNVAAVWRGVRRWLQQLAEEPLVCCRQQCAAVGRMQALLLPMPQALPDPLLRWLQHQSCPRLHRHDQAGSHHHLVTAVWLRRRTCWGHRAVAR